MYFGYGPKLLHTGGPISKELTLLAGVPPNIFCFSTSSMISLPPCSPTPHLHTHSLSLVWCLHIHTHTHMHTDKHILYSLTLPPSLPGLSLKGWLIKGCRSCHRCWLGLIFLPLPGQNGYSLISRFPSFYLRACAGRRVFALAVCLPCGAAGSEYSAAGSSTFRILQGLISTFAVFSRGINIKQYNTILI